MVYLLTYCGGIPEFKKIGDSICSVFPQHLRISRGIFKKVEVQIPYESITDVTLQSNSGSLVIEYTANGLQSSAIFRGEYTPNLYNDIIVKRAERGLSKSALNEPAAAAPVDVAAEIQKFHDLKEKGVISEEEFNAKKSQLLGI